MMMNDPGVSERIEIYLSCHNLKDLDVFSKSDPYIKISYKRDFSKNHYALLGRTETINNDLNPNFSKSFSLDYIFESRQDIKYSSRHLGSTFSTMMALATMMILSELSRPLSEHSWVPRVRPLFLILGIPKNQQKSVGSWWSGVKN